MLALVSINNSKESTKSLTKHCNSKKFCILRNILQNVFFSSQIYLMVIFYTAKFKSLNIARAPNEMK